MSLLQALHSEWKKEGAEAPAAVGKVRSSWQREGKQKLPKSPILNGWVYLGAPAFRCAQGGIRHCDQQGKKRFHVVILARVASATHKPLIATAKRKLADMELAEITDHRFRGRNVIFRWIVKLGESGWQADKAVVQQSPKTDTSHSTLT